MAQAILMPKAGISVESCIMGVWRKKPGDIINIGDILFDYETDKAAFECESTAEGTLLDVFFDAGDEVPCLVAVCAIGQPGEDISDLRPISDSDAEFSTVTETSALPITTPLSGAISPRAKNMSEKLKIDPLAATPSGPRGRIIERDILAASQNAANGEGIGGRDQDGYIRRGSTLPPDDIVMTNQFSNTHFTDEKMTPIRKTIAKSMIKSLTEIAQLTHHHSCDATTILTLRKRLKQNGAAFELEGVTIGDMVLYATIRTLQAHPSLNAHLIDGDTLRKFNGVHLGLAVDTPRGLLVPTIFDADKMSLLQLSKAVKNLAMQAKSGNISPDLLSGASFTVSNLGALGVEMFTPVINPPQVTILGVCGMQTKVREINGDLTAYQSMGLSLTYDHRAIDGADASRFASDLCKNIENMDLLFVV